MKTPGKVIFYLTLVTNLVFAEEVPPIAGTQTTITFQNSAASFGSATNGVAMAVRVSGDESHTAVGPKIRLQLVNVTPTNMPFSWIIPPGTKRYKIEVSDEDGKPVSDSNVLQPTTRAFKSLAEVPKNKRGHAAGLLRPGTNSPVPIAECRFSTMQATNRGRLVALIQSWPNSGASTNVFRFEGQGSFTFRISSCIMRMEGRKLVPVELPPVLLKLYWNGAKFVDPQKRPERARLPQAHNEQVNVPFPFPSSPGNRGPFTTSLESTYEVDGGGAVESTDECLNTVVNALPAANRAGTSGCTRPPPLQENDFTSFRPTAAKFIVLITDNFPGGFCDAGDTSDLARGYADQAGTNCFRINSIQIGAGAIPIMLEYRDRSCGWYSKIPSDSSGLIEAIVRMLYVDGACNCP